MAEDRREPEVFLRITGALSFSNIRELILKTGCKDTQYFLYTQHKSAKIFRVGCKIHRHRFFVSNLFFAFLEKKTLNILAVSLFFINFVPDCANYAQKL
jgi:hypothetical protein